MLNKRIYRRSTASRLEQLRTECVDVGQCIELGIEHNHDLHIARLDAEQAANLQPRAMPDACLP